MPHQTRLLRARVLRDFLDPETVEFDYDTTPGLVAFAALDETGEAVGSALILPEVCPWRPDVAQPWRLRGMATAPELRGQRIGEKVLTAAMEHAAAAGGELIWCYAHIPALRFYERLGYATEGDVIDLGELGPHQPMAKALP